MMLDTEFGTVEDFVIEVAVPSPRSKNRSGVRRVLDIGIVSGVDSAKAFLSGGPVPSAKASERVVLVCVTLVTTDGQEMQLYATGFLFRKKLLTSTHVLDESLWPAGYSVRHITYASGNNASPSASDICWVSSRFPRFSHESRRGFCWFHRERDGRLYAPKSLQSLEIGELPSKSTRVVIIAYNMTARDRTDHTYCGARHLIGRFDHKLYIQVFTCSVSCFQNHRATSPSCSWQYHCLMNIQRLILHKSPLITGPVTWAFSVSLFNLHNIRRCRLEIEVDFNKDVWENTYKNGLRF